MNAGQYCKRLVVTIATKADIAEAAKLMRDEHVGYLVVLNEGDTDRTPVGVVTDRDIVLKVMARDMDPHAVTVADVMTREPIIAKEQDDLAEVMQGMRTAGIRRLPVVNASGSLTGIIALDDAINAITGMLCDMSGSIRNEQRQEWQADSNAKPY
jgi:CBS domain-containing protein